MTEEPTISPPRFLEADVFGRNLRFLAINQITERRAVASAAKEPAIRKWIDGFARPCVFWDIGANVGVHSIYAAMDEQVSVFAFEPNAANHYVLAANAELNGLGSNFSALCMAFGDTTRLERLCCSQFEAGASFPIVCDKLNGRKFPAEEAVATYRIDDFVKVFNLPIPNYIKIDVPTVTDELLAGATQTLSNPSVREAFVELDTKSFAPGRFDYTMAQIAEMGFRLAERHQKKKVTLADYHFIRD